MPSASSRTDPGVHELRTGLFTIIHTLQSAGGLANFSPLLTLNLFSA